MTRPSIIVHGGAGPVATERVDLCRSGCEVAAKAGYAVLEKGGSALDAVEVAVRLLEGNDEFNAGYGATLNRAGGIETDASLMDGRLRAGAVAAVPFMRHPVSLARKVLEDGVHILLVGQGALAFAESFGIHPDDPLTLITPRERARWDQEKAGAGKVASTGDTVGAAAIDSRGGVAAGSSTGGLSFKYPGRVGDSPIVGAGLYAMDGAGAATATGHGESILKAVMCKFAVDQLRAGRDAASAAQAAISEMIDLTRGEAGIIVVDRDGNVAPMKNTSHMPWASVRAGQVESGV